MLDQIKLVTHSLHDFSGQVPQIVQAAVYELHFLRLLLLHVPSVFAQNIDRYAVSWLFLG
ncbi:hypothetical protein CSC46_0772 [Pseudomonas aeruginosa]|nr:hypothetical protein CSC46_0772 [Pseudomonas aeruginosa]